LGTSPATPWIGAPTTLGRRSVADPVAAQTAAWRGNGWPAPADTGGGSRLAATRALEPRVFTRLGARREIAATRDIPAPLASGLNNASFQIGGAVGVAILSSVAVSGAHGADSLTALTSGYQSAFAAAIAVAAFGVLAASLLLGRSREPRHHAVPEAAAAAA
jgi:hypothetical protein